MKSHQTITITRETLQGLGACLEGLYRFDALLPVCISTDPEENLDIAINLTWFVVALGPNQYTPIDNLAWLVSTLYGHDCASLELDPLYSWERIDDWNRLRFPEPGVLAQLLAIAADRYVERMGW